MKLLNPMILKQTKALFGLTTVLALLATVAVRAGVPEPDTVFYGKVVNRTTAQEYVLTSGVLRWVITQSNGNTLTLGATLGALKGGDISYRLNIPHQALALGLDISTNSLALPVFNSTCSHVQITVDGQPVKIIAPGAAQFSVAQLNRAATHRLDLEVSLPLADTDGDGIPDWWAQKYKINNANADSDGDGWSNLTEYRNGSNPTNDNRSPSIATKELLVYADGSTGLRIRSLDADSTAAQLVYTVTSVPDIGALYLRNAVSNAAPADRALAVGATFTQDDVDNGRIVLVHNGSSSESGTLGLSLRDESSVHTASSATIALLVYRPEGSAAQLVLNAAGVPVGLSGASGVSADEQPMVLSYLAARDRGFIVWDASRDLTAARLSPPSSRYTRATYSQYVSAYGAEKPQILTGGTSDDQIIGGMANDVITGGRGNNRLRGNAGADLFVITPGENATIEDFTVADNDVVDLSKTFTGSSVYLTNFVQLSSSGTNSFLRVNSSGTGNSFNDVVVTLAGTSFQSSDLYTLVEGGQLLVGDKKLAPRVSIAATVTNASENGPTPALFTLSRTGPTDAALTVNVLVTGSAVNGVDYEYVPSQVTFAAGQRTATIVITPYPDTITENTEVVQVLLQSGTDYILGNTTSAQVYIEDLAPMIAIEALDATAVKNPQRPGYFLISRSGIIDRSVFVRLTIGGRASNGTDYDSVATFVNFSPYQTSIPILINPKSTAVLSNGAESVKITIKADPAYKLGSPSTASMMIVDHEQTFADWKGQYFPENSDDPVAFAAQDFGARNVRNLQRYAYQIDARNPVLTDPRLPKFQFRTNELSVVFRRSAALTDVQFVVEASSDLKTWKSDSNSVEQYFPAEYANDPDMVCIRAKNPVEMQFLRVRVLYTP